MISSVLEQFTLIEVSHLVVRLVQTFAEIEPRDNIPFTEDYAIAFFSKRGVQVGLKPACPKAQVTKLSMQ